MKKLSLIVAFITGALFLGSCEGPTGPEGKPGPAIYPEIFEYSFSFDGDLDKNVVGYLQQAPVKVYEGDIVLAYIMTDVTKDNKRIWTPMPYRYFVTDIDTNKEEELEFTYNFSPYDIEITASASTKLRLFNGDAQGKNSLLKDRVFRVAYIPAQNPRQVNKSVEGKNVRTPLSYEEAVAKYNLQNVTVKKQN